MDIPSFGRCLKRFFPKNNKFDDYEVEHVFSSIGHKIMLLNARRITQKETVSQMILLAIEDITEKMRLQGNCGTNARRGEGTVGGGGGNSGQ